MEVFFVVFYPGETVVQLKKSINKFSNGMVSNRSGMKNAPTMKQAEINAKNSFRKLDSERFLILFIGYTSDGGLASRSEA